MRGLRAFLRLVVAVMVFGGIVSGVYGRAISLSEAKKRNPQVTKLLKKSRGRVRKWVKFLLEDMPTIDLVSLNADSMLADLYALDSVLDSVPWADEVPEDYFYTYVLPYRVSQEPIEYFRKNHWHELWERVKSCGDDMKCAVYRLNEWAYEEMKYEPTSRWDQTAEQTLVRGIGRCEEMAILFIKACRAMGIPARDAYTPYWPFTNSNHAWVEVWTGDRWHFVGGAEVTPLDNAWFDKASKRAAIIKGIAWGELDSADVPIYYAKNGFTVLNLTPLYSDTTGLTVEVLDQNSAPVESADVWISVFNFSSLRAVAHHYTGKDGKAHFVLGKAGLFVSAGRDSLWNYAILPLIPGNTTYQITLKLSRTDIPDTAFWLRVVKEVKVEKDTSYKPDQIVYCRHNLKQERLTACPKEIMSILPDSSDETRLLSALNRGRGNREAMIAFWKAHPDQHEDILNLWEAMATKDLLLPDSAGWEKLWSQVEELRSRAGNLPDSIFWNYVANPRILWEDFGFWYDDVWKIARKFADEDFSVKLKKVRRVVEKLDTLTDRSYFGGMMNPAQVLKARTGGRLERLAVFVALMRVLGVPARIGWDYSSAEYLAPDANEWKRYELPSRGKEKEGDTVRTTGVIRAKFVFNGQTTTDVDYYDDFSLTKISDGVFDDITPPKEVKDSFVVFKDVPVGKYAFMTGWRNAFGAPFVRIKPMSVVAGTTDVVVEGGFPPPEMVAPGDLLVRKFSGLGDVKIKDTRGRYLKKSDWAKGKVIVAFFDTEHESSISTAKVLAKVEGIPMLIFVLADNKSQAKKFCRQNGLKGRIFYGDEKTLKSVLKFKRLPSILLLSNGEAIMWTEGLNLAVDKLIQQLR